MLPERSKRRNLERIRLRRTPEAFLGTWLLAAPSWRSIGQRAESSRPTPTLSPAQTLASHDVREWSPRLSCISYRRILLLASHRYDLTGCSLFCIHDSRAELVYT